ncbi:gem-associated protein 5-like [Liolophura sinensis]|uniref:gem-associated protein 5-like n=1 Tax=Liolophura sinensis TaxID=3198878 RepID=UPI003158F26B
MSVKVLPASPNWYSSKVSDVSKDTFVFGARQNVYVYRLHGSHLVQVWAFCGHRERVTSVTLCHARASLLSCCSADEDGKVKLWDVDSRAVLQEHEYHNVRVSALSWSPLDEDLIVSGDEKGAIVSWRLQENRHMMLTPESGQGIVSLACSTQNREVLAVGYKNGLILLVSLANKGHVIHRLRGHDDEVHSLAWCSFPGEDFLSSNKRDNSHDDDPPGDASGVVPGGCLLASGCKNRTVAVWSTAQGKVLETFKLPTTTGSRRERWDEQGRGRIWVTVCWPPHSRAQFISSSHNGDLLQWDLTKTGKTKWELFNTRASVIPGHFRIVFNVSCGGEGNGLLVSTSMDRQIVVWDLASLTPKFCLPTLGGFVYAVESSPLDPGQIAVGVGDNLIRVWNISDQMNPYKVTSLWQGIKSKVTALSWHPSKEGLLAYGTDDGRVGIYQTLSNKPPQLSSTYHKKTVYVINWGPPCPALDPSASSQTPLCVYSVGDGLIKEHLPQRLEKEAVDFHTVISATNGPKSKYPIRSDIRWKQDFTVVAVGNDDGSVELFTPPNLRLICVIRLHQKLVNCVRWHPLYTAASPTMSPCRHWVATGSNENTVYVVDLTHIIETLGKSSDVVTVTSSTAQLEGHSGRITGLSWSPHVDGQLVSASYDGTAQVWNVLNKEPVANFRGHIGKLLCAEWSPLEEDVVMTGADDFTLQVWKISEQETKTCPAGKRKSKGRSKSKKKGIEVEKSPDTSNTDIQGEGVQLTREIEELLAVKRRQLLAECNSTDVDSDSHGGVSVQRPVELTVADILGEVATADESDDEEESSARGDKSKGQIVSRSDNVRKKRRTKSFFPILAGRENCSRQQQHQDLLTLVKKIYLSESEDENEGSSDEPFYLGLYLSRRAVYKCLKREGQHHLDHDNMDYYLQLEIWKGNIRGALKFAREREELSDWLVAMAPMASHQMWVEACQDYALQLEAEGQFHKAASYYLAAHKVYDAINLFRRHRMFREAVALAKLRLSPLDPAHEELYATWGQQLTKEGHFEQAAKCYVAIKQVREAAKVLARRTDQQSLRAAAHMNFIASENQEGLIYAQKVVHHHLVSKNWAKIHEFCEESKQLKVFILLACLHELMLKELPNVEPSLESLTDQAMFTQQANTEQESASSVKIPEFMVDLNESDPMSPWKPHLVGNKTFPHHVLRLWCTRYEVAMEMCSLEDLYTTLKTIHQSPGSVDTPQLLVQVSYELSRALLSLLLGDTPASIRHFNVAVSALHTSGDHTLMQAICRLFFPLGPNYVLKLQHEVTALRVLMNIDNHNPYSSSMKSYATRKYWSEPREDDLVSNGGLRCRELDCLRAYYYVAVVYHLQEQLSHPTANTPEVNVVGESESAGVSGECRESSQSNSKSMTENPQKTESSVDEPCKGTANSAVSLEVGVNNASRSDSPTKDGSSVSMCNKSSKCLNSDTPGPSLDLTQGSAPLSGALSSEKSRSSSSGEVSEEPIDQGTESQQEASLLLGLSPEVCDKTLAQSPRWDITLSKLKYLSKCLLWDIQGKRVALTETLGYVHRAMSQLLLHQTELIQTQTRGDNSGEQQSNGENSEQQTTSPVKNNGAEKVPHLTNGTGVQADTESKSDIVVEEQSIGEKQLPGLLSDVVVGLPNETFNIAGLDNYVSISDLWKHPSLSSDYLQSPNLNSPFHDYVKPKKILWKDSPEGSAISSEMSRRKSLDFSWSHDNGSLPAEWNSLPVDKKYTQPYITQDILQQEEEFIKGELLRGPDADQVIFPNPLHSAGLLLDICDIGLQSVEDKIWFSERVADWALFFSVTSLDRELFAAKRLKNQPSAVPHCR